MLVLPLFFAYVIASLPMSDNIQLLSDICFISYGVEYKYIISIHFVSN